jgi:NADH dehydrogenase FAD-containing subunit
MVSYEGMPHVVIIGGGFGGIAAAKALRHTNCRVTLIAPIQPIRPPRGGSSSV